MKNTLKQKKFLKTKEYVDNYTFENSQPILICDTSYKVYDILGILKEKYPNDSFYWRPKLLITKRAFKSYPKFRIRYAFYFKK